MSLSDEISKLEQLKLSGALTEEEFVKAKARLIEGGSFSIPDPNGNQWAMFLHLSMLAGYLIPIAGWVLPIVIWQTQKDRFPEIDQHGRHAVNWLITHVIYAIVFGLLTMILIGIPLLIVLAIVSVVFPVVAGIKANEGKVWPYPTSIPFF